MANINKPAKCHPGKLSKARGLCANCYSKERYRTIPENREKRKANSRKYTRSHPEKIWEFNLRDKFKLERFQYNALLEEQDQGCAICGRVTDRKLSVDHEHTSGAIRGLLCSRCNLGIGAFHDNPILLQEAALYLRGTPGG